MRWTAFFLLSLMIGGCTVQSIGQRCQQNADCNTATDVCREELHPERECAAQSCICCPADPAAALAYPACVPRVIGVTDSGVAPDR